jgi:hypothetical protein
MADMLSLPTTKGNLRTFTTAAGTVSTDRVLKIEKAMLPCLSTNRTFTIETMESFWEKNPCEHSTSTQVLGTTRSPGATRKSPWFRGKNPTSQDATQQTAANRHQCQQRTRRSTNRRIQCNRGSTSRHL